MVTPVNNWTTSYNNIPADQTTLALQAANGMYLLKTAYLAAGYTLVGCSDGSTAGIDATDRLTAANKFIWAAAASPHSWFIVRSQVGQLPASKQTWITYTCGNAGNYHLLNISFATAVPTGGSTTADPTQPAVSQTFTNKQWLHSTILASKFHYQYVTATVSSAPGVGNFVFETSVDTTGRFIFGTGLLATQGYETGDNYACIFLASFLESGQGCFLASNMAGTTHVAVPWIDGLSFVSATAGFLQISLQGTDVMTSFPATGSAITGNYPDFPLLLYSGASSKIAFRGYVVDLAWAPSASGVIVEGTVEPASGSTQSTIVSTIWFPNNNVTPSL